MGTYHLTCRRNKSASVGQKDNTITTNNLLTISSSNTLTSPIINSTTPTLSPIVERSTPKKPVELLKPQTSKLSFKSDTTENTSPILPKSRISSANNGQSNEERQLIPQAINKLYISESEDNDNK